VVLDLDDAGLQGFAHLRGRQADPGRVAHRLRHVVEQPVEELAEAVGGQALQPEPRVTKKDDGANSHRRSIPAGSAPAGRAMDTASAAVGAGPPRRKAV